MICNTTNCTTERSGPVQNDDRGQIPEAGPSSSPTMPARLDWDGYCRQEDSEPFDVIKKVKGAVQRRDLCPDLLIDLQVQEFVRRICGAYACDAACLGTYADPPINNGGCK